jgi:molybdenum cofactor cytidylyltransferase
MLGGLILAAGAGSRFSGAATVEGEGAEGDGVGGDGAEGDGEGAAVIKQLALFRGKPLLQWAVDAQCAVAELERVVVVLGAHSDTILPAIDCGRAQSVICADWQLGLSASLKLGMRMLAECDRVIVTLGDQPLIDAATIRLFVDARAGTRGAHAGRPGHPVVLGDEHRAGIDSLTGDRGAGALLTGARLIELGPESVLDIDQPADLQAIRRRIA